MSRNRTYAGLDWGRFNPLLRSVSVQLFVHWIFQGLLYMDTTERTFKLAIDLMLTLLFWWPLSSFLGGWMGLGLALVGAHSLNFILNAHVYSILRNTGLGRYEERSLLQYTLAIQGRLHEEGCVLCAGLWGGFARQEHTANPDVDMRVVRRSGFANAIRACWFALGERSRAFWNGFPLDLYVLDDMKGLSRLRHDEIPIILHDPDQALRVRYERQVGHGEEMASHGSAEP